ncbi:apoptosis facilitator Bcl-2 14 [Pelobates cultripes]|uniref:Apoptosis facilitator Bcl-2 14 n=1 Tax=Pelobates cultripes TaxID=61616 RepID=A0AAD1RSU2_PELCU|nr:apoptosis facilitator Bcl-2 14 [Pelobates cultripes]
MTIAKILRESGDSLDEEMQKNRSMFDQFRRALCYDFYKDFLNTYIGQPVPLTEPEVEKKRTAVALCFDVTSKLTTLDNQPMNKVLGFGAHYIKEYFTPWVESQGGWEKALDMETDKEVE